MKRRTPRWIENKRETRTDRKADGLQAIPAWALLARGRFGEADLCQYPDQECNAPRVNGTGFCDAHVATMRERACEEIRESYGMCSELEVA